MSTSELKAAARAALDAKGLSLENIEQEVTSATQLQTILQSVLAQLPSGDGGDGPLPGEVRVFQGPVPEGWEQIAGFPYDPVPTQFEALRPPLLSYGSASNGVAAVAGGLEWSINSGTIYRFNPNSNTWTTLSSVGGVARCMLGLEDGRLLAVGDFQRYSASSSNRARLRSDGVWNDVSSAPFGIGHAALVQLSESKVLAVASGGSSPYTSILEYDLDNDQWTVLVSGLGLTSPTMFGACVLPSGRVLIVDGRSNSYAFFDPTAVTLTPFTGLPPFDAVTPEIVPGVVATETGALVVLGSVWSYDEATNTWAELIPFAPLCHSGAVMLDGDLYIAGRHSIARLKLTQYPIHTVRLARKL